MTAHWLDRDTLVKKKGILTMREMESSTGSTLAQAIWETHNSYDIVNKIVSTTTDNGRNFISVIIFIYIFKCYLNIVNIL